MWVNTGNFSGGRKLDRQTRGLGRVCSPPHPACAHLQLGLQESDVLVLLGQLIQQKGHILQAGDTVREL